MSPSREVTNMATNERQVLPSVRNRLIAYIFGYDITKNTLEWKRISKTENEKFLPG